MRNFFGLFGLLFGVTVLHSAAQTDFYVDPDWTGAQSGTASQPWTSLTAGTWTTINASLAAGPVTVFLSALKADQTQQSRAWYLHIQRSDYTANRLTMDGYSFYNASLTSPAWRANPQSNIAVAFTNHQVFRLTGGGSCAIGWERRDGNDIVSSGGLTYYCISSHLASAANQPGTGANWPLYWDQHGAGGAAWTSGASYKVGCKQDNVTLRGFEITGNVARSSFAGDNFVWEHNYIHDITGDGPGLSLLYTSYPDSSSSQMIARPSTNITLRDFRIVNTTGEALYLGAINPDATPAFQLAHGNQHSGILITNFYIYGAGANGAQGDSIDCKHGLTGLHIVDGEISFGINGFGIILPETAIAVNQDNLVERVLIHDLPLIASEGGRAMTATTDGATATSLWGHSGLTVRNCVVYNTDLGILVGASQGHSLSNCAIYNCTVWNVGQYGVSMGANATGCFQKNNFCFKVGSPSGHANATGVLSDYNAWSGGTWDSPSEGPHTLNLTAAAASAAVVNLTSHDFHLAAGSPLLSAGAVLAGFSDDFDGRARPTSAAWDIGAYNHQGPLVTINPPPTNLRIAP